MFHLVLCRLGGFGAEAHARAEVLQLARADVGGHYEDGVLEIDLATHTIGELSLVKDLQQHIVHVVVGFLDFIKQYDRVGLAAYLFGKLAALFVSHVARRRTDETRYGVLLHIFAHIDADDGILRVEKILGQHLGQVGFAHTGGTEEDEGADGLVGVLESGAVAADGLGNLDDGVVLADDLALQLVGHLQQARALVGGDALRGHARHHRDDFGNRVFRHDRTLQV